MRSNLITAAVTAVLVLGVNAVWTASTDAQLATGPQAGSQTARGIEDSMKKPSVQPMGLGIVEPIEDKLLRVWGGAVTTAGPGIVVDDDPAASSVVFAYQANDAQVLTVHNCGDTTVNIAGTPFTLTVPPGSTRSTPPAQTGGVSSVHYTGQGDGTELRFIWVIRGP